MSWTPNIKHNTILCKMAATVVPFHTEELYVTSKITCKDVL